MRKRNENGLKILPGLRNKSFRGRRSTEGQKSARDGAGAVVEEAAGNRRSGPAGGRPGVDGKGRLQGEKDGRPPAVSPAPRGAGKASGRRERQRPGRERERPARSNRGRQGPFFLLRGGRKDDNLFRREGRGREHPHGL